MSDKVQKWRGRYPPACFGQPRTSSAALTPPQWRCRHLVGSPPPRVEAGGGGGGGRHAGPRGGETPPPGRVAAHTHRPRMGISEEAGQQHEQGCKERICWQREGALHDESLLVLIQSEMVGKWIIFAFLGTTASSRRKEGGGKKKERKQKVGIKLPTKP